LAFRRDGAQVHDDRQVGPTFSSYHGNGGSQSYSAGITGTVTASFSSSLEVGASAASLAQIKATINGSLAASVAVSASLAVTQPVPVAYWGNGRCGRYRTVVTGHSYHTTSACSSDVDHGRITAYAAGTANAQGWCLWVSTAAAASVSVQCYNGSKFQA